MQMTIILLLMGLLKPDVKEVNVKAIDLTPANSIVEKVENNQEKQVASKINKPRKRRNTGAIFSPEEDSAEIKKPRARRHTWTF